MNILTLLDQQIATLHEAYLDCTDAQLPELAAKARADRDALADGRDKLAALGNKLQELCDCNDTAMADGDAARILARHALASLYAADTDRHPLTTH